MASVYSVGQVNQYIKNMFTQDILLTKITIKGEVSNCKYHTSGHIYFTLKDATGTLAAVMFAGYRKNLTFLMEDGMQVLVTGSVSVYERDGKYQLYATQITQDGEGDLFRRYQKLKNELEEMGMFAKEYKKPIPRYASKVGIVTASTGAAIRDIMNISARRNPYVQLYLYPAIVQGENAAPSIVKGIQYLDEMGVDVIIVGRGGGSIEDLWAFNEEAVARAIFDSQTPIISAVGHETDFTIADFVSDLRAPTPSAAAELAVFDINEAINDIKEYRLKLSRSMCLYISNLNDRIQNYQVHLKYLSPMNAIKSKRQQLDQYQEKLFYLINHRVEVMKKELGMRIAKLDGLSPMKRLMAGYAYVEDGEGKPLHSVSDIKEHDTMRINMSDGVVISEVRTITKHDDPGNNKN